MKCKTKKGSLLYTAGLFYFKISKIDIKIKLWYNTNKKIHIKGAYMKKSTIIFILALIAFFFLLDLFLHRPNKPKEEVKNTGIQIVSTPISANIKEEDYILNTPGAPESTAGLNAAPNNSSVSGLKSITTAQEKGDYTLYVGDWIYGHKVKTVNDVKANGGLIISIFSYDKDEGIAEGKIEAIQEPPMSRIASIEFQSKIKDGVIYFEFDDDGFKNSGNGIITLDGESVKIRISTVKNSDEPPEWSLANGLFILQRAE